MRKQIVFLVSTKVIKLAILELFGDSLEGDVILGCYKQLILVLSNIKACSAYLLYKFLSTDRKLCDLGNFLKILSLYPYKGLKFLPCQKLDIGIVFMNVEKDFKKNVGLTLSNGGVFGHELPEFQVILAIVIEKVKQTIDSLLE
jgi:hypothetical protein